MKIKLGAGWLVWGWWALHVHCCWSSSSLGNCSVHSFSLLLLSLLQGMLQTVLFLLRASSCFRNSCNILRCHMPISNSLCCCLYLLPGHGIKLIKYSKLYTRDKIPCKNPLLSHWKHQGRKVATFTIRKSWNPRYFYQSLSLHFKMYFVR